MTIRKKLVILFGIIFLMVLGGVVTVAGLLMIAPAENNSNSENIVSSTVSTSNQNNSENVKAVSEKYILINRSAVSSYYFNYLYDSFRFTKYANPDKEFMIVSLEIENYGYDEFKVNPYNYKVVVDNVSYTPSYFNYNIPDLLKSVTLKNGGKTYGILVYELPENSRWYHIEYTGSVGYKLKYGDLILEKEIVEDDEEVILSLTNDIDTGFEESDFSN